MNVIQLKRQSWNLAIILLALVLGLWRISQLPQFGAYEARTFVLGILPIALLSMGQAIIIIGGGINLAIGAEAVLINCLSAKYMQDTTFIEICYFSNCFHFSRNVNWRINRLDYCSLRNCRYCGDFSNKFSISWSGNVCDAAASAAV